MDSMKTGWFSELSDLWPGMCLSLKVEKVLHKERSKFQDIMVLQTEKHGKALILDGIIQCTESDEFSYQEMISFLPLCSHPSPKKVLIVGGGDGGVAREVAKHPEVESIAQVEIDEGVISASRRLLPSMGRGLDHPKLSLHVGDGTAFMASHQNEFDVIITDSSDPVGEQHFTGRPVVDSVRQTALKGPAEALFQQSYFELMRRALREGGVVCSQAGTVWASPDHVSRTLAHCRRVFPAAAYACASVPTYPTGQIGFVLGSLNKEANFKEPLRKFSEDELNEMSLRYYDGDVHRAAFALPRFAVKALSGAL